jgi:hypothetical protein
MERPLRCSAFILALLLLVPAASATPVAQTEEERETYGRTFLEPSLSWDYIQMGEGGHGELEGGLKLLAKLYPRYLTFTTVGKELGSKDAVSVGPDGFPSWHRKDTGDGIPFHLAVLTDRKVPDRKKEYVALMASHQAEPCGREGMYRLLEDLIIWATEDPEHTIDNATGVSGKTIE